MITKNNLQELEKERTNINILFYISSAFYLVGVFIHGFFDAPFINFLVLYEVIFIFIFFLAFKKTNNLTLKIKTLEELSK